MNILRFLVKLPFIILMQGVLILALPITVIMSLFSLPGVFGIIEAPETFSEWLKRIWDITTVVWKI